MALVSAGLLLTISVSPVAAKTVVPVSPKDTAATQKSYELVDLGERLLTDGHYSEAEQDFRAALAVEGWNVNAYPGLAESLAAQGKTEQALRVYRSLVYQYPANLSSAAQTMRTLMRFASLLSQTGQWEEAVSVYENGLPKGNFTEASKLDARFDLRHPMPLQLQALSHIAVGLEQSSHADNDTAFAEYDKGLRLAPDNALTNYFYGAGWQKLSPTERAKFGTVQQAKAHLQKAVKTGNADVKAAAQKALKELG